MQGVRWFSLSRSLSRSFLSLSVRQQKFYCSSRPGGMTEQAQGEVPAAVGVAPPGMNCSAVCKENRLVWVDLEMTGLDVNKDHILEMACVVTDENMNIISEGLDLIVHQPDSVLDAMGSWCEKHHGKSGLTEASRRSNLSLSEVEDKMLSFVQEHTPKGKCPLAGNSIHMDKRFIDKYMERFSSHFHYRLVDVSSIKELCRRWYPKVYKSAPLKMNKHRALDDIRESIEELRFYKENIFKPH